MLTGGGQLGRIIPCVVVFSFVLDALLRLLPLEVISFRAWEAASRYAHFEAPFEPNKHFHLRQEFGDLANMGNLPRLREYRPGTTFTTDSFGFRNKTSTHAEGDFGGILIGDSSSVGATLGDEDTLAAQLAFLSGCRLYNAAGLDLQPNRIIALAQQLGMSHGVLIDEVLEGAIFIREPSPPKAGMAEQLVLMLPSSLRDLVIYGRGLVAVSPLRILIGRGVRVLQDDRILPNPYAASVVRGTLQNGEEMLFLPEVIEYTRKMRVVAVDRWVRLSSTLERAGLKLLVVLLPRKYTVYQPLLRDEVPLTSGLGETFAHLEHQLRAAGIAVLNLTEVYRVHAARDLEHGAYLYWRDDTHWNARGVALAASEIHRTWSTELAAHCQRTR